VALAAAPSRASLAALDSLSFFFCQSAFFDLVRGFASFEPFVLPMVIVVLLDVIM
jgi:hypothetical protein